MKLCSFKLNRRIWTDAGGRPDSIYRPCVVQLLHQVKELSLSHLDRAGVELVVFLWPFLVHQVDDGRLSTARWQCSVRDPLLYLHLP